MLDLTRARDPIENRRRKWDCFHVATAVVLNCSVLYTTDKGMLSKQERLSIRVCNSLSLSRENRKYSPRIRAFRFSRFKTGVGLLLG